MDSINPQVTSSLIGTAIGNYRVLSQLGAGAMGEVYLGEHPEIGRKVAIKVLVASLSANPEMSKRFISEARAVNKINHPNIIQIYDFGRLPNGRLYFTMEYLKGRELSFLLKESAPLSLEDTLNILRQISAALDAAHNVGIVHRDLKPDNIFIVEEATGLSVRVLDFGIAKLLESEFDSKNRTSTGMIMGTPLYMSPEQAAGDVNRITQASDIYSLGVIVYQMLSARFPIQAPTTAQILAMHIVEPPVPLKNAIEGLPDEVCLAVDRTLTKEPTLRPQTAGQFLTELMQACTGTSMSTVAKPLHPVFPLPGQSSQPRSFPPAMKTDSPLATAPTSYAGAEAQAQDEDEPLLAARPSRLLGIVVVVLVLAAAVGVGAFFMIRGKRKSEEKPDKEIKTARVTPDPRPDPMSKPLTEMQPMSAGMKIYKIKVDSNPSRTRVEVQIAGQARIYKTTPFDLEAKDGERITLRAERKGFEEATETFLAHADRALMLAMERKQKGVARRYHSMKKEPSRETRAGTRDRPRGKSRVGEGTLKPTL